MYQNILVPVAPHHPANSQDAIDVAQTLRATTGKITLLTVLDHVPEYVVQYLPEGQMDLNREQMASSLLADVEGMDNVDIKVLEGGGSAGIVLIEYAKDHDADLIVIASHRPGLQDYFLGSTAARVVRHAPCAVHVVR